MASGAPRMLADWTPAEQAKVGMPGCDSPLPTAVPAQGNSSAESAQEESELGARKEGFRTMILELHSIISALAAVVDPESFALREQKCSERLA